MKPFDRRLLRRARATRGALGGAVAVGLASTACVVAQAALLASIVSRTFLGGAGLDDLRPPLAALAGVLVLRAALAGAGELVAARSAAAATTQLRAALLERASRDAAGRRARPTGELAALATTGLDAFETYVSRYIPTLVLAASAPLIVLAWIAAHDRTAGVIVAVTIPLIPLFMVLVGLATTARANARLATLSELGAHFLDVVQGLPTLRAFRRGRAQGETIRLVADRFRRETMATLRVAFLSAVVLELMATLATALVAVAVGLRLAGGGLDFQTALAVLVLVPEAYLPIRAVGAQFHSSADGVAAVQRALDVIEAPDRGPAPARAGDPALTEEWALRLEGVTVADGGRPRPALDAVDLVIRAGERVALVGPSGSGKSTLLSVLVGLTPPTGGRVLLERPGRPPLDLATADPAAWRGQVAWAPQQPTLFTGTVADNVRLGNPSASEPAVWAALRKAGLHGLVAALPAGLAAEVGEDGARLSAGERQRLALARAFLRPAPLVLLDEPTSSLDPATEAAVEEALAGLARERTLVVVAHRLRLARSADRVIALDGGRVVHDARPALPIGMSPVGTGAGA